MIESLDLNLATRPFRNNTLLWTGYSVGFALLIAFAVWNVTTYVDYGRRLAETKADLMGIDDQVADLDRREARANRQLKLADYDVGMLTSQAEGANGVIEWKAFSWTGLFNRMAAVQPWNVHLSSVRPTFQGRAAGKTRRTNLDDNLENDDGVVIVVEGFAKSLEALLDFERALFKDSHFDRPEPKRHQPTDSGEVVFEMDFTYYADGMPNWTGVDQPDTEQGAADADASEAPSAVEPPADPPVERTDDDAADADAIAGAETGSDDGESSGSETDGEPAPPPHPGGAR